VLYGIIFYFFRFEKIKIQNPLTFFTGHLKSQVGAAAVHQVVQVEPPL